MTEDNKLIQLRDKLREALEIAEEIQEGEIVRSGELDLAKSDIKNALRAVKEHGDAGDWIA